MDEEVESYAQLSSGIIQYIGYRSIFENDPNVPAEGSREMYSKIKTVVEGLKPIVSHFYVDDSQKLQLLVGTESWLLTKKCQGNIMLI